MKKLSKIESLEQVLRLWEDAFLIFELRNQSALFLGQEPVLEGYYPLIHRKEMRDRLLSGEGEADYGMSLFMCCGKPDLVPELLEKTGQVATLPMVVAPWSQLSRRVYRIDSELQLLFENTSLDGVLWKDLKLPFDAFAIELEAPLVCDKKRYDFVVVVQDEVTNASGTVSEGNQLLFYLLSSEILLQTGLSVGERSKLLHFKKRMQWVKLFNRTSRLLNRITCTRLFLDSYYSLDYISDMGLFDISSSSRSARSMEGDEREQCTRSVLRIMTSLILYLESLPKDSQYYSEQKHKPTVGSTTLSENVVTDGADICTVLSNHVFSSDEQEMLSENWPKSGGWTVRPHFRTGFWRRERGMGHIPDAPRSVWVRPTLVAGSKLPEGAVPHGSKNTLKV